MNAFGLLVALSVDEWQACLERLAQNIEQSIRLVAIESGQSFDEAERNTMRQVLEMGRAALAIFVKCQGDGDLDEEVSTPDGKRLKRRPEPKKGTIRSVFGEIEFFAYVYDRGKNTKIELAPVDARIAVAQDWWTPRIALLRGQCHFMLRLELGW